MGDNSEVVLLKQECIKYLDGILNKIRGFDAEMYAFDDDQLTTLNIQREKPLDIEEQTVDFGRRFFRPRFTLEEAWQKTTDFLADHGAYLSRHVWPERCRRGSYDEDLWEPSPVPLDPEERHPLCFAEGETDERLKWFLEVAGMRYCQWITTPNMGVCEGSAWEFWDQASLLPNREPNLPWYNSLHAQIGTPPQEYTFRTNMACLVKGGAAEFPHVGATVVDVAEAEEGEVLRSEVAAAVGLLKYQFRRGDFCRHHTLPGIVFSFQHDRFARITQFYFDGTSPVLRQSRLLNLHSDEPTTDAYHLIRWMDTWPIGETQFRKPGDEEAQEPGLRDVDKSGSHSSVNVKVRGT